ncbi:MAG: RNA methyltransferase [Acidimicrobiales bacterium]|nr:RNA methyltransferase [Acidimicrobiales bacterium]HRW37627.1 RNA methyltransferase [Aquihabitans sp.]
MRPLSVRNPRIARLTRLVKRPGERAEQRALVVEGPVLVGAALDAGAAIRDVYVDEAAIGRPAVADVLQRLGSEVEPWALPAGALDRIGDVATSQGMLAIVDRPEPTWPVAAPSSPGERAGGAGFVVVLAGLQIPGNVGTLIRAAAAAGARAVICAGGADPSSPKVVRASAGAWFGIDVIDADDPAAVVARLQRQGWRVATAVVRGGEPYDAAPLDGPLALVLGSEAHGAGSAVEDASDLRISIPMAGSAESLNVAMAGTVLCFEIVRRSRANGVDGAATEAARLPPP